MTKNSFKNTPMGNGSTINDVLSSVRLVSEADLADNGWTVADVQSALACTALDRFRDVTDAGYPDSSSLVEQGCNMVELLEAAVEGLNMGLFAEAVGHGLDVAEFTAMLAQKVDSIDEVNTRMARFCASPGEVSMAPDALVSAFTRLHGEGGFCNHG